MTIPMKTLAMLCGVVFMTSAVQSPAAAGDEAGVRRIAAFSTERGIGLDVTVWYPAVPGGQAVVLGDTEFFVGTPALRDAPVADGRFPLVVLSHGAGLAGNAEAVSWIAAPLAKRGFVVAAPTHPGNAGAGRSAAETMKLWLRPADLTQAIDAALGAPFLDGHLDHDRLGALGLSMGGSTVLAIAGARLDANRLAGYCDTDARNPSLCDWVRRSGVDLHAMDLSAAGRSNRDGRVRFVMAVDPAPVDVFVPDSFSGIPVPAALINLGRRETIPLTALAASIAAAMPNATYATVDDASHYSMFAECKPHAAELAEAVDIGDPICRDGGGRARRDIHDDLIGMAVAAFDRALKQSRTQ